MQVDYLVVGSGLTGATIARALADAGREVLVVDRRSHLGGNVHDTLWPNGVRVHTYGPHYFRTSSPRIWEYATRFDDFHPYEARVLTQADGLLHFWPLGRSFVDSFGKPTPNDSPRNFEEAALSLMPRRVYELFVKEYTEKQWGVPATQLSASLCKRFDVREDDDTRFSKALWQGIPRRGYAHWMREMLSGVPTLLSFDYLKRRDELQPKRVVYTGPIDELFGCSLGRLKYRSQRRVHTHSYNSLPAAQVNNPTHAGGEHVRTLDWRKMMPDDSKCQGTIITTETPYTPTDPNCYEYPFPDTANARLYVEYKRMAAADEKLTVCGRLGEYRYYDMDQAIAAAMVKAEALLC